MQKINFQDLPSTSTPLNASNLNQLQTNVENAINLASDYSTSETIIGKWIDARPIYRKVLTETCDGGTTINIAHNISNLNEVTNLRYFTFQIADKYTDIPLNANNPFSIARITSTNITGTIAQGYDSYWVLKIIIEYTKSSDPVG